MRVSIICFVVVIVMLVGVMFMIAQLPQQVAYSILYQQRSSGEDLLDYADFLLSKGVNRAAAEVMEEYVKEGNADKERLAKICYRIGNIYMGLYEYEKALKYFYRAEMLDKNASFKEEMDRKIVEALESLGMSAQAKYELAARTSLGSSPPFGKVVARVGKRKITSQEIEEELDSLSTWMRSQFKDPQQRLEFIKNYVAREVLYEKGRRLGIDKTPEVVKTLQRTKKQIVVEKLLSKEIEKRLKIDSGDLLLYYKANKEKYTQPARIKVRYISFSSPKEKERAWQKLKNKGEGIKEVWIYKREGFIPGIGEAKEVVDKLFLKKKGEYTEALKIKDKFYFFFVEDKQSERVKSFDEVKAEVENEYRMMKQREITDSLLKEALGEEEVEIYYEPSAGKSSSEK